MTDPFTSDGAKMPPKPFTIEEGRRQVRSFVLRQGRMRGLRLARATARDACLASIFPLLTPLSPRDSGVVRRWLIFHD